MKKYSAIIILLLCVQINTLFAQHDSTRKAAPPVFNFGLGVGIDYGGIGTRFTLLPGKHIMTFAAIGYNFAGPGVNVGFGYLVYPDSRTCPYFLGMYGYNAAIKIVNASQYDETYYGPTVGIGMQLRNRTLRNYFNLELLIPFRPQEFRDDLTRLKLNKGFEVSSEPPPFGVSIGYHFG